MSKSEQNIPQSDLADMLHKLERLANIGWWKADFNKQIFIFSDYICEVLQLKSDTLSFEQFMSLVHPDHRDRIEHSFFILQQFDTYDETFPIMTPQGYWWIHSQAKQQEMDKDGNFYVFGYAQYFNENYFAKQKQLDTRQQIDDLLKKHNSISKSLLAFLKNTDTRHVIVKILNDILQQFKGDRVYIFEYDWDKNTHSCTYEVTLEGISPEIETLQNQEIKAYPWWTEQFLQQRPVILNTLDDLPDEDPLAREVLGRQNIKSLMAVPLISDDGLWGYMGVDLVNRTRVWNNLDYEWFNSFANIISICLQLRKSNYALSRNEERLRKIYRTIPIGIETYDKNGLLKDINDFEMEIFGIRDKKDVIGLSLYDNPNLSPEVKNAIHNGQDTHFQFDYNFFKAQNYFPSNLNGYKHLSVKGTPLRDKNNNPEGYLLIVIDDTDTLNAYNKIKEFENFFTFIAEFAEIGLYKWNPIQKVGFAFDQWFKNMNESHSDIKDVIGHYSTVHPDDVQKFNRFYEEVVKGEACSMQTEIRIKDGNSWKWIRCHLKVKEYDPEKQNIEVIGVNINISGLKEVENKLREAKLRAEESDRLKSAFLANMSHEIRTPLNAIVGFSNILAETEDLQDKSQYLNIIQRNTDLLLQLISDILDLSKIEAGSFDIIYEPADINALCQEIVHTHKIKANPNVELLFDNYQPDCTIHTDRNRLSQVISNLVNNALKFTANGTIKIGYQLSDNEIKFYVDDTGIGIAPEKIQEIFNRFVKLNTFANGTGLGLAICKSIIEKMNGQIGVKSEAGKGSYFWFTLPLKQHANRQHESDPYFITEDEDIPLHEDYPVILIAEDTDSNYLLLKSILKHEYRLIRAQNGREAIELCKEKNPAIILMDIKMPEMDGLTATRHIRSQGIQTPIIALTAFAFDQDKEQAIEAGCNNYIAKPVRASLLKDIIHEYTQ